MGRRYVVFFEPALANLDAMGNHMATRLENQITDFLDAWRPEAAFAKPLQSDLWQFGFVEILRELQDRAVV